MTRVDTEMQKVADPADIFVLFFSAGASFWAILGHFRAILGHFWANLGSFLGYFGSFSVIFGPFFVLIFCGKICLCAI